MVCSSCESRSLESNKESGSWVDCGACRYSCSGRKVWTLVALDGVAYVPSPMTFFSSPQLKACTAPFLLPNVPRPFATEATTRRHSIAIVVSSIPSALLSFKVVMPHCINNCSRSLKYQISVLGSLGSNLGAFF